MKVDCVDLSMRMMSFALRSFSLQAAKWAEPQSQQTRGTVGDAHRGVVTTHRALNGRTRTATRTFSAMVAARGLLHVKGDEVRGLLGDNRRVCATGTCTAAASWPIGRHGRT